MPPVSVTDRARLFPLLAKNRELHIYELGDLDPFFFPHTRWYVRGDALCLLYSGSFGSTLLAFEEPSTATDMRALLAEVVALLPPRFYAHLTPGLARHLGPTCELGEIKPSLKMSLREPAKLAGIDTSGVVPVRVEELESVEALYADAYPGNWFDARMLETGRYFGIKEGDRFIAIAGVHVYSPEYRVAALGNIVTRVEARGRGLGKKVAAALCNQLLEDVDVIGLNVMSDNAAALACYRQLGFEQIAAYEEMQIFHGV